MFFVCVLGNQDHEEGRHGLAIRCAKRYGERGACKEYDRFADAGDTRVRDGKAISEASGCALLPSPQRSEDQCVIDPVVAPDQQSDFLECASLVSGRKSEYDVLVREKTTNHAHKSPMSHGEPRSPPAKRSALSRASSNKREDATPFERNCEDGSTTLPQDCDTYRCPAASISVTC